jgi:hypothetical protein
MSLRKWQIPFIGWIYKGSRTEIDTNVLKNGDPAINMTDYKVQVYNSTYDGYGLGNCTGLTEKGLIRATYTIENLSCGSVSFGPLIPAYATITDVSIFCDTILVSSAGDSSAYISFYYTSSSDIMTMTTSSLCASSTYVGTRGAVNGLSSTYIVGSSSARYLTAYVAGGNLTSGKFTVFAEYVIHR